MCVEPVEEFETREWKKHGVGNRIDQCSDPALLPVESVVLGKLLASVSLFSHL